MIDQAYVPKKAAIAIALFFVAVASFPMSCRAELRNRVVLGFDSFIDRFTILDDDTTESVQGFYAGLGNDLLMKGQSADLQLRNYFRYGTQTMDDFFDGELSLFPRGKTRIDLRTFLSYKHFQKGSDYDFGNDFIQSNTYLRLRRRIGEESRLTARGRFETVDYERRTDFDYDYFYYDGGLEFETGSILKSMVRAGAYIGEREAPDTTAMSHGRSIGELETYISIADYAMLHLVSIADRRTYREKIRSSYWLVLTSGDLMITSLSGKSLTLRLDSEYTAYDEPNFVYFDTHFIRGSAGFKLPFRGQNSILLEPRLARMICRDFGEERYYEYSVILGIELFNMNDFWIIAGYEPGYRDYIVDDNDLYSDFYLNRLSVMGSIPLPQDFSVNLFAMHDPERHLRREDNFSILLFSVDLTKRF